MRLGVFVPNVGSSTEPAALIRAARHAEELGFDSVWVADRLLYPVAPRNPYPASRDGKLPAYYQRVLDPLATLAFLAAHTTRVRLGTCILDVPFYNPVVVGRTLTTVDVLSGGRLQVGCGQGWSEDEFEAVGLPATGRGARTTEFLQVLKAVWTEDPVEFHGRHFSVPRSVMGLKPVQKPHPPIFLAAFSDAALKRAATIADGWMPARVAHAELESKLARCRELAAAAGRDPAAFHLQVVAIPEVTPAPLGGERAPFAGSLEQLRDDVARTREVGAAALIFQIELGGEPDAVLAAMDRVRALADR
ncbi:MAG: LLM class flavin-dependent oxidoreductase [Thermodesulfobacteriota bacterium]